MKRELPMPIVALVVLLLVGGVGFYYFYWSNRSNHGAGVTREEMKREFDMRAKRGMLPMGSPQNGQQNGQPPAAGGK